MNSNICVLYKSNWSYKFPVPGPVAITHVQQTNQNGVGWLGRQWEIQTRRNYQQRKYHRYHRVESLDVFNVFNHLFPMLVISCKGKHKDPAGSKLNSKAQLIADQRLAAQGRDGNDFPKWRFVGITTYSKSMELHCCIMLYTCQVSDVGWKLLYTTIAKMKYYLLFVNVFQSTLQEYEKSWT